MLLAAAAVALLTRWNTYVCVLCSYLFSISWVSLRVTEPRLKLIGAQSDETPPRISDSLADSYLCGTVGASLRWGGSGGVSMLENL